MPETIRLSALTRVLEELGYVLARVEGSHRVFVHQDKKQPSLFLPAAGDRVSDAQVGAVRRILAESGITSAAEFDASLLNPSRLKKSA